MSNPIPAPGQAHADQESTEVPFFDTLFLASTATPIHPATSILDPLWEDVCTVRAAEMQARLAVSRMEVRSYFSAFGQSAREDYHKAFAHEYGMIPIHSLEGGNGYISFEDLAYYLNRVDNLAGPPIKQRHAETISWRTKIHRPFMDKPLDRCNAVCHLLDLWASCFGQSFPEVPTWRWLPDKTHQHRGQRVVDTWKVRLQVPVEERVPYEVRYVEVEAFQKPIWRNPHLVNLDDKEAQVILEDSLQRSFARPGVEGLSVIVHDDDHQPGERMHLVYWITDRFPHRALGRDGGDYFTTGHAKERPAKRPLAICTFPYGTDPDDAVSEMYRVSAGMSRTRRDGVEHRLLPAIAAALDAERPGTRSAPDVTGSHEWLTMVADQRETGETYRPRGATADD